MTNSKVVNVCNELLSKITSIQSKYKKIVLFGAAAFLLILALITICLKDFSSKDASHVGFKHSFEKWIASKKIDELKVKELKMQLKKMPELMPIYQWKIIQQCLVLGDVQSARSFLKEAGFFAKPLEHKYFHRFSEISLLIANQDFERAHEESLLLKQDLMSDVDFWKNQKYTKFGSDLFAYNLVRIGFISKALLKKEAELQAWAEVIKYSQSGQESLPIDHKACAKLFNLFSADDLALNDYIAYRQSLLK